MHLGENMRALDNIISNWLDGGNGKDLRIEIFENQIIEIELLE